MQHLHIATSQHTLNERAGDPEAAYFETVERAGDPEAASKTVQRADDAQS